MTDEQQPVSRLRGVGPALASVLARLGIETVLDVLFHLPYRYEDRTRITPLRQLQLYQPAVIEGEVVSSTIAMGRRRSLMVVVDDGTGRAVLRFFHFNQAQQKAIKKGMHIRAYGEVRAGAAGLEMYHPEYRCFGNEPPPLADTLTPVYSITEGITQQRMRKLVEQAFASHLQAIDDLLPAALRAADMPDLPTALRTVHFPPAGMALARLEQGQHPAQQRLALEELLAHQISLLQSRAMLKRQHAQSLAETPDALRARQQLLSQLGFQLTAAQQRVWREINADMGRSEPMWRLVQGDVGSGKTIIAALAAINALALGKQVALMAPTEILAEQHYESFAGWFAPLQVEPLLLTGSLGTRRRKETLEALANGSAQLVIGTHALFQSDVAFSDLALVVIDEQHRFGVHQRLALRNKATQGTPHQLVMTATPIPRTLAMGVYGNMDFSVIDELPPGRTPVKTTLLAQQRRPELIERIRAACSEGRQAYWVCTLIEESDTLQVQAAEETHAELVAALPGLQVGLIHGRMRPAEKHRVMTAFAAGEAQVLVATTVIEVGVNVPNASLMIIENAERLGLAQLHQLRGRVGRGALESFCVLLYQAPLSDVARERLDILRQTNDGFLVAEKDLQIRGPGEVLGTRQTGEIRFRFADLLRDEERIPQCMAVAEQLFHDSPMHARKLMHRWQRHAAEYLGV